MVKVSYQQKPYRRVMMETYGAQVFATHRSNRQRPRDPETDPNSPGSLGIATPRPLKLRQNREARRSTASARFKSLLMHQTVIGEEALKQMDLANEYPDVVIGSWARIEFLRPRPIRSCRRRT